MSRPLRIEFPCWTPDAQARHPRAGIDAVAHCDSGRASQPGLLEKAARHGKRQVLLRMGHRLVALCDVCLAAPFFG